MLRIDSHTHVWPDKIATRALAGAFPELPRQGDGRTASLLRDLAEAGMDRAICLGVANEARHVAAVNRFSASLPAGLIGFGSVHPDLHPDDLVADLRTNHLKGVKLHPIVQRYRLDEPALRPILDALAGEFVVVVHVGGGGPPDVADYASPDMLRKLVREFPRLDIIACHFGAYLMWPDAEEYIVGLPVYLDTSWPPGLAAVDPNRVATLVQQHGHERIVFGSDWPMAAIADEVRSVEHLGLPAEELELILGGNLQRLLGIAEE